MRNYDHLRVWDAHDEAAATEGRAIRKMVTHSVKTAQGSRHIGSKRNRKTAVATPNRTRTLGELGILR